MGKIGSYISIDQMQRIVELSQKGLFRKKIAEKVNVSPDTVYRYQKRFGLV